MCDPVSLSLSACVCVCVFVFTVNCWPEDAGGGKMNVNLEYTLQPQSPPVDLNNVVIAIPL